MKMLDQHLEILERLTDSNIHLRFYLDTEDSLLLESASAMIADRLKGRFESASCKMIKKKPWEEYTKLISTKLFSGYLGLGEAYYVLVVDDSCLDALSKDVDWLDDLSKKVLWVPGVEPLWVATVGGRCNVYTLVDCEARCECDLP